MQIIQTIRDKGAAIIIAVIALSLIGFLLMDAKSGSNKFFNSLSGGLGKVNGQNIEKADFDKKFNYAYELAKQQSAQTGQSPNTDQVREQVWNQVVNESIFYAEAAKLGIEFTGKELTAVLYSNDPSNPLMSDRSMLDPAGKIDPAKVVSAINTIKKAKGDQYDQINNQIVEPQKLGSISGKYYSLLNASAYYPSWMQENDQAEGKSFANISYAFISYGEISDSTVKVSDSEIEDYIAKHKNQYKQEAGRIVSYVTFSQAPSAADSFAAKEAVAGLVKAFAAETNDAAFVARNTSAIPYDSNFIPKAQIRSAVLDSIVKLPVGSVYGPYMENGNYVIAKFLGAKGIADSAKARHILIPTVDPQTGQPINTDSAAKKKADSLLAVINAGGDFAALAKEFSTDGGSKDKGGVYDYFEYGKMMPAFNDFAFNKPAGTKGVVQTPYGYHVIEAMGTKGSSSAYKIAYVAREILTSEATFSQVNLDATKLSAQKNKKEFEAYIAKNGLQKTTWPNVVKENDYRIGMFADARALVRWAFEAKKGDVSEPFNIGDAFVVAVVDRIYEEGTMDAAAARAALGKSPEGVIRNKKKAEIIIKKLGANTTPEAAAAAYNKQVQTAGADSSITFNSPMIQNLGNETKVIGASFNKDYQSKSSPAFAGTMGVYVLKVNSIGTKAPQSPEILAGQVSQRLNTLKAQVATGWFEGLRNQATIKDSRSKYF
ncbi:MAG: peptidylprolyl isomerase [Ferruginibacter sp.]